MTPNKINNHFLAYSNILDVSKMCFYSSFIQIDSGKALVLYMVVVSFSPLLTQNDPLLFFFSCNMTY